MLPDKFILERLAGDGDVAIVRKSILSLFHSGREAQWELDELDGNIRYFLDDPANAIYDRILSENALRLSHKLFGLARQLLDTAAELDKMKASWRLFEQKP